MASVPPNPPPPGPGRPVSARPPLVMTAAVLLFIVGAINVIEGFILFGGGGTIILAAIISLAVGALAIYAGVQIMNLRAQGRVLGLIVAAVGAVFALITIIAGFYGAIIGLIIYGIIIYALVQTASSFTA